MKILCTALAAVCLAGTAHADTTNDVSFTQDTGADGQYHFTISVSYVFPGLPPRAGNFGAGTVRVTLPGAGFTLDPAGAADPGYSCFVAAASFDSQSGDSVTCSNDGQPTGTGLTFPTSVTIHLVSPTCWAPPVDGSSGTADVWAAPGDPGTAPDASLPIAPPADCTADAPLSPALGGHLAKCRVPKLAGAPLRSATGKLRNAHCARGKVRYAHSKRVKKGRVISQSQKPRKLLGSGARVDLVVSKGP